MREHRVRAIALAIGRPGAGPFVRLWLPDRAADEPAIDVVADDEIVPVTGAALPAAG